jgi:hypothetical protein
VTAPLARTRARLSALRLGPAARVSLGLTALVIACVLVLDIFIGIFPDESLLREQRERSSRQIAAEAATAIASGDAGALHQMLNQAVMREKQVLSTAVRRTSGELVAQTGGHAQSWIAPKEQSDIDQVRVPLLVGGEDWANVEISFVRVRPRSASDWLRQPKLQLFLLLGGSVFVAFALYLRRVFEHLNFGNPSLAGHADTELRAAMAALQQSREHIEKQDEELKRLRSRRD